MINNTTQGKHRSTRTIDANKHQSIVSAATQLFMKHGYTLTSMDMIANAAKVSKQTVYRHFINKEALFSEIVKAQCIRHIPKILLEDGMSAEEVLSRIGKGFLAMITSKEGLATHRLIASESERRPEISEIFYRSGPEHMKDLLSEYLKKLCDRGELHIKNVEAAAFNFLAMLKGYYQLRLMLRIRPLPSKQELESHLNETVGLFIKMYARNAA